MKNMLRLFIVGASLTVLSGCSSVGPQASSANKSTYIADNPVSIQNNLYKNINVEVSGFLETTKNIYSPKSTSNLNNEDAKKAISQSLDSAGLLADSNSDYVLTATMIDPDLADTILTDSKTYHRNIRIHYILERDDGSILYNKVIGGNIERQLSSVHHIWREQKKTSERSYKNNFKQLVEDLKEL